MDKFILSCVFSESLLFFKVSLKQRRKGFLPSSPNSEARSSYLVFTIPLLRPSIAA